MLDIDHILPNRIITHSFCNFVTIKCNGTSLHSFVEPALKDSSKWRNILNKGRPITKTSLDRLTDALSSKRVKLSATAKKDAQRELEALTNTILWRAIQTDLSTKQIYELKELLPINIQIIMSRKDEKTGQFSFLESCPGSAKINNLEKVGSYDALAALILLIRREKYRNENFGDTHVHQSVFRLLLSFFQHPSFYEFRYEIWQCVLSNVVKLNDYAMSRMGLCFWTMGTARLDKIIRDERELLSLAINANIIQDFKDAPLFFYLLYRNQELDSIISGLKCIHANKQIDLMPLDSFYHDFSRHRRRGRSTLDYPSSSYPYLAIQC